MDTFSESQVVLQQLESSVKYCERDVLLVQSSSQSAKACAATCSIFHYPWTFLPCYTDKLV